MSDSTIRLYHFLLLLSLRDTYFYQVFSAPNLRPQSSSVLCSILVPLTNDSLGRAFDLSMKEIQNAKERDADDWKQLFENADPRLKFCGAKKPPLSTLAIMEAIWEG